MQLESQVLSELDAIEGGHNNTCAELLLDVQTLSNIVMKDLKVCTCLFGYIYSEIGEFENATEID